jgi:hypothetical protein
MELDPGIHIIMHSILSLKSDVTEVVCHTLKYLILGCEYLSEYVHLSIGFFKNFPNFLAIILFFRRAKSIY